MTSPTPTPSGPTAAQSAEPQEANLDFDPDESNLSLVGEFIVFLKENRKWWLAPLITITAGIGLLIVYSAGSAIAPFLYSLF